MATKYLLIKGTAGLGNRIFVLVTAILYARMSDRVLLVDWADEFYTTRRENVFWNLFELKQMLHSQHLPTLDPIETSVYPTLWSNSLACSLADVMAQDDALIDVMGQGVFRKYACDVRHLGYPEDVVITSGYDEEIEDLRPLFQGEYAHFKTAAKGAIFNETFHRHVVLSPSIRQRLEEFKATHFKGHAFIGIHIRKSDKAISYGWYQKALNEHVARYPKAHIFLATDNREVERDIRERYANQGINVVTLDKWLPAPGVAVHGNQDCPDLEAHAAAALLDIYLLASCDYLIYSRTTSFGRLASYISEVPTSQHFDIQQYNDQRQKDLKERVSTLRNKIKRNTNYAVSWLKLKGLLPS